MSRRGFIFVAIEALLVAGSIGWIFYSAGWVAAVAFGACGAAFFCGFIVREETF